MPRGIPKRVIDGDTFVLGNGGRVRPTGYDAPEKGQPGWQQAKAHLEHLVLGKTVGLSNPVNYDRGRSVRQVTVNGQPLENLMRRHNKRR